MKYTRLGRSGLTVSRLALGCMSYGDPGWRPWVLDERAAPRMKDTATSGQALWFPLHANKPSPSVESSAIAFTASRIVRRS